MKFLPAAHITGEEPVFPNRWAVTRALIKAFAVKDNEVRKHIHMKDLSAKAPAMLLELFGSVAPELLVNAAPENESALPQPEEVLSSMENAAGAYQNENLKQPPSLGSNTGGSGGGTTLGSEDDVNELQRIHRGLADLGFKHIDEVQQAITENTIIWITLAKYGVRARTAAALEQELNGLKREQKDTAIAGAPSAHAAVFTHVLDAKEHAEARAKFLEESNDQKELLVVQLKTELVAKNQKIRRRNWQISNLRAQVRHLENNCTMASANLSDTDGSSDHSRQLRKR